MAIHNEKKEGNGKRIAFLFIPYLCAAVAAASLAIFFFMNIAYSGIVQLFFDGIPAVNENTEKNIEVSVIKPIEDTQDEIGNAEDFPIIYYETQWATLNIDGWQNRNIPVLLGDTPDILKKGAGLPMFSEFCGWGNRVVLDAHVTSFFREIEDTQVGTAVHVSTVYGQYEYVVDEIVFFDQYDSTYIYPSEEKEELVLYTCYPFDNNFRPRTERIALICSLVKGKQWRDDFDY